MTTAFIDWTESSLNMYRIEKHDNRYSLMDTSSVSLDGDLSPEVLKSLSVDEHDTICLSVPLALLTLREQDYPFSDKNKIRETIPYELEGIVLGDVSDYVIDHVVIESTDLKSRVLVACLEKAKLKSIIDMFSSAGLEPKSITSLDLRFPDGRSGGFIEGAIADIDQRSKGALDEVRNPTITLRQDELAYTGHVEKFIKNLRIAGLLVLVLLVILAANFILGLTTARNEHQRLTDELQGVYRKVFPEDKTIIDAERQFKGNMKSLLIKKEALGGIPVLDILRDMALHNKRNVRLHEFSADGKNLIMKGSAVSFEDVESLKNDYLSVFESVKVTDSDATGDAQITFTIVMQEKGA